MRVCKEILDKMPIAMLYVKCGFGKNEDLNMEIEYVNNKMLLLLGMDYKEVIYKDFFDVLSEYKKDKDFIEILKNPSDKNSNYTKYLKQLKDFINISIQKEDDNHFSLYFENCIDKRFLEDIQRKDQILFIKDIKNRYVYASENFKLLSGCDNEDIYGLDNIKIYGQDEGKKYAKSCETFIKSKKFYRREICKLKDKIYSLHRYGLYKNNELIGVVGILEDIIGKMEKINDGNTLSYITNNISEYIILKDSQGVYLDCNNSFLKDLSLNREEVIGKKVTDIPKLNNMFKNTTITDLEVINTGRKKIYNEEVLINGKYVEFEIIKEPFMDTYGNLVGIIDTVRDISHRSEIERLRIEFFANLSHELRTPLNLIFSALQIIKSLEEELLKNNKKLAKYISIISQNSKRLLKLVNNLIDSTKIDCGYYEYKPKNENIVSFVESIAMSVAEFAKQNNITLIFDTNVEEKVIAFDLEILERIMLNLLSNSIKYNNTPGKIVVLLNDSGESFNITVRDTGIGIPNNKLGYIFERFKQVENRLRKRNEGSGIGLSLVRNLVEIHGGIIEVKSEVGVGSEFTVKLPVEILNDQILDDVYYKKSSDDMIMRMNVEFSDIYI